MDLSTPLATFEWIAPPRVRQLERMGVATVADLLTHFPKRYEDRTQFDRFPTGDSEEPVCVCGIVKKTTVRRIRGSQKMFDAVLEEETPHALSQPLVCRWFNAHWVEKMIVHGHRLVVFGKPKRSGSSVVISHPEFEIVEDDAEVSIHLKRIAPIHRATEGLSPRVIRMLVWDLLGQLGDAKFPSPMPASLDAMPHAWALRQIHFPESWDSLQKARRHFVLAEFFAMQLSIATKRAEQGAQPGAVHFVSDELMRRLHAALPFPLTGAQKRAIAEIQADLAAPRPMNRLLHGDVGSGKTLVALSAMLLAVEAGWQAALMAPTQILAEQHYLHLRALCEPLGIRVALRTAARRESSEPLPLFAAAATPSPPAPVSLTAPAESPGGARDPRAAAGDPPAASGARFSQGRLPHFEHPWAIYAVAFNTLDSRRLSPQARDVVMDAILHWKDRRYELFAACVMPDHVHLLIQPLISGSAPDGSSEFFELGAIMHSIKSWTAHQINDLDGEMGGLWQKEWFDRYARSDRDLAEKYRYILANPWSSGEVLEGEDYRWCWAPDTPATRPEMSSAGRGGQHAGRVLHPEAPTATGKPTTSASRAALPPPYSPLPRTDSEPDILIGTHALLYEGAGFTRLGLAVIDEQHKFGVLQRARLRAQGAAPDVLVMTATPIPRTLTMTLYGDLDVSTLDEMPKNRCKIVTAVREESKVTEAAKFLREHLEAGRQAYIVYPLIDESEKLESKAAAAEYSKWQELLAPMKCELLHGRIAAEEKEAIMSRFRSDKTKALIATTVIEVGIDVPNANLMLIENAERFGLAQLHQLRGRIGRGTHKSYCILLRSAKADAAAIDKLAILEGTSNGFEIAEADLRLRGPGDILGTAQSGLPPLKLGDLMTDQELMRLARNAAFLLIERDPQLTEPEHRRFRTVLAETRKLALSQVS